MKEFLGLTIVEWVGIFTLTGIFVSMFSWITRTVALGPLRTDIKQLNEELKAMNASRKENEKHLFKVTDDHTKDIIKLEGRVNTIEVVNNSNTLRIDRMEK